MGVIALTLILMLSILTGCASSPVETHGESVGVGQEEKENPSVVPVAITEAPEEPEEMVEEILEESQEVPEEAVETPGEMVGEMPGELIVEFIDVGQGDSILIISPDGKVMLIDAGDQGNLDVISQRLKFYKVDTIHALVATHPHADHIGSMSDVIENYNIEEVYMPDKTHTTQTFERLLLSIQAKNLGINTVESGDKIFFGDYVHAKVVAPVGEGDDLNNYSVVIHMTFGETRFLFTGDMESGMESRITENIEADVLKVGHHGSSTSSSQGFLDEVQPKHSVISVGAGNKYDHPDSETFQKLSAMNSKVYRTDESGTITMLSDGKEIKVSATPTVFVENTPAPVVESTKEEVVETPPAPDTIERIVYGTATGSKYHLSGCRHLSKSKIEMTLTDAKSKGLEPCGTCKPGN